MNDPKGYSEKQREEAAREVWPDSTCIECGRHVPAGRQQICRFSAGGFCVWRFPSALNEVAITLCMQNRRLRDVLKPFVAFHDVYSTMQGLGQDDIYSCHSHVHGEGILTGEMFNAAREALAEGGAE